MEDFNQREKRILSFWQINKVFEKSINQRPKKRPFVFYDGPPFATGLPHYGHILASFIKDVIPRYWAMRGFRVERRWGWDCHGLPIENLIEQELNLHTKKDIEKIGIEKFNNACRQSVLRYVGEWRKIISRIGRWVDMENSYKTMDREYMESLWWVFKNLWDKNLIYEGYKSMHLCPRCETTLSNFEVTLGYKETIDISVVVKFKSKKELNTYFLAWTTTPWTLPGNVALAVGGNIRYVKIKKGKEYYILAKERLAVIEGQYQIIHEMSGKDLENQAYEPLFDFYYRKNDLLNKENGWKVYLADFVSLNEGTGIVHLAPAFGEDDLKLSQEKNLPFIQHVKKDGTFEKEIKDWQGLEVKTKENPLETDEKIVAWLEKEGKLFKQEKISHNYPFCWRCDTPLLNYATSSWFIKVTVLKEKIIKNNQKINWVPGHIKNGRFGKWLEEIKDWSISRLRYWGTPLPVWRCHNKKCQRIEVIGSLKEIEKLSKKKIKELHRPDIDEVEFSCKKCGGLMKRVEEVLDCWFESGSMPYAQIHYPFENKKWFVKNFPAQFIAEGIDQTRGWFYTLLVLSTALFNKPAFLNVVVNGIILAEDGTKMSKRLKNYPEPIEIIEKYGADALRYYFLNTSAIKADDLFFSAKGVEEVLKNTLSLFKNIFQFYQLYVQKPALDKLPSIKYLTILDKWIISRLNSIISEINQLMERYNLFQAVKTLSSFIDDFSLWYLRRSRTRFKNEKKDRELAGQILGYVLKTLTKVAAPFMPFLSEDIFQKIRSKDNRLSVHLENYPLANKKLINLNLEKEMSKVRNIVSLILSERAKKGLKVRQPLKEVKLKNYDLKNKKELLALIKEEVNIKEIIFDKTIQEEIWLDTSITPELKEEGLLREIMRQVQELRREAGFKPQDKIFCFLVSEKFKGLILKNAERLKREISLKDITTSLPKNYDISKKMKIEEDCIEVFLKKS